MLLLGSPALYLVLREAGFDPAPPQLLPAAPVWAKLVVSEYRSASSSVNPPLTSLAAQPRRPRCLSERTALSLLRAAERTSPVEETMESEEEADERRQGR